MSTALSSTLLAVLLLVVVVAAQRLVGDLRSVPRDVHVDAPTVSVSIVVPARNEADTLPTLLASLRALSPAPTEVVVVDDASEDPTAAVARAAGATVVPVVAPAPGWTGKAWACQTGADATRAGRLLFLDADTELAPDALAGLVGLHEQHGGLVSVQPFHQVRRPYEQLSAYFNVVSILACGAFGRRAPGRPMAFGPCLLTSRSDYERAGGHEAVRAEVLDDVRLAGAYHRAGLPVHCLVGGGAIRMRMYPGGVRQLAEGWTKNIASGASAAALGPTVIVVGWVAAQHAVAVGGVLALIEAATGRTSGLLWGAPVLWAVAWVLVAAQLRWLLGRLGSFRWWTWALFPIALVGFDVLFARSLVLTALRRSVRWRGRDVPVSVRGSWTGDA